MGLGPSISSVIDISSRYSGQSYPSSPVYPVNMINKILHSSTSSYNSQCMFSQLWKKEDQNAII